MDRTGLRRRSAPHSTVERLSLAVLPPAVHRFLFSQSGEFVVAHLVFRALFGALSGTVLFLAVASNLPPTFDLKLGAGLSFVAVCAVGGALSSSFRCSILLMFPSMLGSRGHSYLMLFILSVLYKGPVSNVQRNVETAALSLSCNLDLQVNHSKLLWRDVVRPFVLITQELTDSKAEFESEALSVSRKFQSIRDELVLQYGYDRFTPANNATATAANSTQEQFTAKTMMQCSGVVNAGVQRCADWFRLRWEECMEAIPVPVINHILCVSMKFHFLCDIMRVMTPWCREHIPVEGNFGQLFDQLNVSVDLLSREFGAELVLQEQQQQAVLGGAPMDQDFTQAVRGSFQNLTATMGQVLNVLHLLLSFTFITIFTGAFTYLRQYRTDIRFDNIYITTYFRQIDARRKKAGKRCLLPLKPSEKKKLINPCSFKIHPDELKQVTSSVFQVVYVSLLCVVLLTVDFALFHVLDIVSRHTFTQFNLFAAKGFNWLSASLTPPPFCRWSSGGHQSGRRLHDGPPPAEDNFSLQQLVQSVYPDRQPELCVSPLLPVSRCVCELCVLCPVGGAAQLPSGLHQPPPTGHRRLLPPTEGEEEDFVSLQPADPETDFLHRQETHHRPRTEDQGGVSVCEQVWASTLSSPTGRDRLRGDTARPGLVQDRQKKKESRSLLCSDINLCPSIKKWLFLIM